MKKVNHRINVLLAVIGLLVAVGVSFFIVDYQRAQQNKRPLFAVEVAHYADGGTREYIGLGYKVIAYASLTTA